MTQSQSFSCPAPHQIIVLLSLSQKRRGKVTLTLNKRDDSGWAAVHYCAMENKLDILQALYRAGASLKRRTFEGEGSVTPLTIANSHGHNAVVKFLTAPNV